MTASARTTGLAMLAAVAVAIGATPASAQVMSLGRTNLGAVGLPDVAYDPKHDVLLSVWTENGDTVGRFLSFDGTPLAPSFLILQGGGGSPPRVIYSRASVHDEFLVVTTSLSSDVVGRLLRYSSTSSSAVQFLASVVTIGAGYQLADIAFNPLHEQFLVAMFRRASDGTAEQRLQRVTASGGITPGITVTSTAQLGFLSGSIAVDWQRDRYLYSFAVGQSTSCFLLSSDRSAVALDGFTVQPRTTQTVLNTENRYELSVASTYLPEADRVAMVFRRQSGSSCTGNLDARIAAQTASTTGTFDSLQPALLDSGDNGDRFPAVDYDPICRCALVVAQSATGLTAVMLDGQGQRQGSATPFPLVTSTTEGRVHASRSGQFTVSYLTTSGAIVERFAATPAATPGPRFSRVASHLDEPGASSQVASSFRVRGWAVDLGGSVSDGSGIDTVHVWAFPPSGSPVFVGASSSFASRTDIATAFGLHFLGSQFTVDATGLAPGSYLIVPYAHSVVSGGFVRGEDATVMVAAPQPAMNLDSPSAGTVFSPFTLAGWAIDRGLSSGGTNVDTIHVWAFPTSGGAPIFGGAVAPSVPRSDVAAAFGAAYLNAGFSLNVTLPPGGYRLVAYAHSTVSGAFSGQQGLDITVAATYPLISLDYPQMGTVFGPGARVWGWAVDLAAASGTGIDAIHVWDFPANGDPALFLGTATFVARPDVAAALGSRYLNAGFALTNHGLALGAHRIAVYAHSSVTGTFVDARFADVTVTTVPGSLRRGLIETPVIDRSQFTILPVSSTFTISGWALDEGSVTYGPGVDYVEVWLYQGSDFFGPHTVLGRAAYGSARPEVGGVLGSRFNNSGFSYTVTGLAPGNYYVMVMCHSTVDGSTNSFLDGGFAIRVQ